MKKHFARAAIMSALVSAAATVGMVLIPRLNNPGEFVDAPSLPVHLLISFVAVLVVCIPVSMVFYWLRDSLKR